MTVVAGVDVATATTEVSFLAAPHAIAHPMTDAGERPGGRIARRAVRRRPGRPAWPGTRRWRRRSAAPRGGEDGAQGRSATRRGRRAARPRAGGSPGPG